MRGIERCFMQQAIRFVAVGLFTTTVDYIIYELCLVFLLGGNAELASFASMMSGTISTFVAFFMHKNVTWKAKQVRRANILRFFGWNAILVLLVRPNLIEMLGCLDFIYQLAFNICQFIHLNFSWDFVKSTGIYAIMTVIIMVVNFMVYDKFVFGEHKKK